MKFNFYLFIVILLIFFIMLSSFYFLFFSNKSGIEENFYHSFKRDLIFNYKLNKSEKEYLKKKKKIKFVTQKNYAPFEFLDTNGQIKGMMVDLLNWISTIYGFEIEFISTNFKEAQDLVKQHNVDGISSLFYSGERKEYFNFSEPIFLVPASIFVSKNRYDILNLNDLFYKKIAMQKGDYAEEFLRKNNIICDIIYVNDFYEAIDMLVLEKADAVIGDEQVVWFHIYNKNYKDKVKVIGVPIYIGLNCFGINKEETILLSILNKGIKRAKTLGVLESLEKKWIGFSSIETKKNVNSRLIIASSFFLIFLIIIFIIYFINYKIEVRIFKETNVQRLRKIIDSLPYIMYLVDENYLIEEVNREFIKFFNLDFNKIKKSLKLYKYKRFDYIFNTIKNKTFYKLNKSFYESYNLGKKYINVLEHFNKENFVNFYEFVYDDEEVFKTKRNKERECEILDSNKIKRLFHINKIIIEVKYKNYLKYSVLAIIKDVTEEKKAENEILKIQKIESVGLLAGKIAHDFNNILTGILGNLSFARNYIDNNELKELIENTIEVSNHAKTITSQLLTFSKSGNPIKELFDPLKVIKSIIEFTLKGSKISYEIYFEDIKLLKDLNRNNEKANNNDLIKLDKFLIYADKNQFFQAINNVVINAIQANGGEGKIKINLCYRNLREFNFEKIKENFYLIISIEDEGPGISKEIADKIYDPFFTTKNFGSGLGLASVKTICKNHEGYIFFKNKENEKGTIFYLLFPSTTEKVINDIPKNEYNKEYEIIKNLNIAIMDDDEIILNTSKKIFNYFGCEVYLAKNDSELFNILNKNKVDICILDLILPDSLGGAEIINILKLKYPKIFFVVSSGYSTNPILANYKDYGFDFILIKPYNFEDVKKLLQEISEIIKNN